MVPTRPEFFYHPAVGVVSPTSLGLFAFKQAPLTILQPPADIKAAKPLVRPAPPQNKTEMMSQTSPVALNVEAALSLPTAKESDMPKAKEDNGMEFCIVSGEDMPRTQMIRFVLGPDNTIFPDLTEKLPGDSFWVKADKEVLKKAIWRNSFTTAARRAVTVPKDLAEQIQIGLLKQSLETINLARKAGLLTQGFAKVEEVLKQHKAGLYIVASDAKENGREKLEKLAKNIPVLTTWTSSQLSASLGVDNAVHIVLAPGGLTDKLLTIANKLKDFQ